MSPEEIIARAIAKVVQRENLDFDLLKEEVPKRFWNKVLEELKDSKNSLGKPWTTMSLSAQWMRKKNNLIEIINKMHNVVNYTPDAAKSDESKSAKPDNVGETDRDFPKTAGPAKWNPGWDEHVKDFIQKELKKTENDLFDKVDERIENTLKDKTSSGYLNPDIPPAPPRVKRKMAGSKGHISARIDQKLLDLFERDRDEKFEGNASRCLSWILWTFYGKPQLSFETAEDEEQDPGKPK